jgi:hypothetical protein
VKARLIEAGAELLHLTTSFRAPPSIQCFINAAFSRAMTARPDRGQAGYVALEKARPENRGAADDRRSAGSPPLQRLRRFAKYRVESPFPLPSARSFIG